MTKKTQQMPTDVTTEAILDLYGQYRDEVKEGASSNDVVQFLDDWFVENGFPTVLYAPRTRRR